MSLRTKCPHCQREAVLVAEALGKNVRCKGCSKPFTARAAAKADSDPHMRAAVKAGAPSGTKLRSRPTTNHDDDDDAPRRHGKGEDPKTLWIGLSAIGAATTVASAVVFLLIVNRHPQPQALAQAPPPPVPLPVPVKQPPAVEPPAPVAKAQPKPVDPPPVVVPPPPRFDPVVVAPPPKVAEVPAGSLRQAGASRSRRPCCAHTLLRAQSDDSFYRLDNARVAANGDNPRGAFLVHFRIEERGKLHATHLMLRFPGSRVELSAFGNFMERDDGTLRINRDPNGQTQFPEDIECCLVRIDGSHGAPAGRFLVSDSVRIGNPGEPARPRDWTPDEIARFTKDAPSGLKENANPSVGVDTEFAGTRDGSLIGRRHVDPQRPLLGIEYRGGAWAGEQCLGALRPIFSADQNKLLPQIELAKGGYAVSGAEVQVRNNIDAIKLHYRRVKPDGSLDPNDAYQGPWIGAPDPAARIVTMGDTGARVLGFHTRSGAVVDGFALVLEKVMTKSLLMDIASMCGEAR